MGNKSKIRTDANRRTDRFGRDARSVAISIVSSTIAAHTAWVLRLVRWQFLVHAAVITAASLAFLLVLIATILVPRTRRPNWSHSWRGASLVLTAVFAGTAAFGIWTLASPASIEITTRFGRHEDVWRNRLRVTPGGTAAVIISYNNTGRGIAHKVLIGDNLPPYCEYIPNTTRLEQTSFSKNKNGLRKR